MRSEIFKCDVCGAQRSAQNHWLLLVPVTRNGVDSKIQAVFAVFAWDEHLARHGQTEHLCGAACAARALNGALEKGKGDGNGNG